MKTILYSILLLLGAIFTGCEKNGICESGYDTVQFSANTQSGEGCLNRTTNCSERCYLHV